MNGFVKVVGRSLEIGVGPEQINDLLAVELAARLEREQLDERPRFATKPSLGGDLRAAHKQFEWTKQSDRQRGHDWRLAFERSNVREPLNSVVQGVLLLPRLKYV